jgi:hypothetical protein
MSYETESVWDKLRSVGSAILSEMGELFLLFIVGFMVLGFLLLIEYFLLGEDRDVIAVIQEIKAETRYLGSGGEGSGFVDGYAFKVEEAPATDLFAYWSMWDDPEKAKPGSRVRLTFRSSLVIRSELWKVELLQE